MVKERAGRKADRISLHSRELAKNLQDWVELRFQLIVLSYWEFVQQNRKAIYVAIVAGFTSAVSVVFLLVAAALGVGSLLGSTIWGFVVIGGMMTIVACVFCRWAVQSKVSSININKTNLVTHETDGRKKSEPGSGE